MRRRRSILWVIVLWLGFLVGIPAASHAVLTDRDICPGTGAECILSSKYVVLDPAGIDITHPDPPGSPALTLHLTSTGVLVPDPSIPLTIKAGGLIIDKGGLISGSVPGATGNTLNITLSGPVTITGKIDATPTLANGIGGDGGSITLTSSDTCQINGAVVANGTPTKTMGGSGGEISFECGTVNVNGGAVVDASGAGPGAAGGDVALAATVNGLTLASGSTVRALGAALDGGSISLSTDSSDPTDGCSVSGSVIADSKTVSKIAGYGGTIDMSCGGDIALSDRALLTLGGLQGGTATIVAGGGFSLGSRAAIKANAGAGDGSGGSVDIVAGADVLISGKIEARAKGFSPNDGEISVTNGGNLNIQGKGATLNVSAGRKDQATGQITLAGGVASGSTSPALTIDVGTTVKMDGYSAGLGGQDLDISGSTCTVAGKIQESAQVQDGASIAFTCDSLTFAAGSLVQVSTAAGAAAPAGVSGGRLSIDTSGTAGGTPGPCEFGGKIALKATSATFTDPISGTPQVAPGIGGSITANCGGSLSIPGRGTMDVSASGVQSRGGTVSLSAAGAADVQGGIAAKASGSGSAGGSIAIVAPDLLFEAMPGTIDASGGTGGLIQMSTAAPGGTGTVSIGKTLSAKGGAVGGTVILMGCDVTVARSGWLSADGTSTGGSNQISGGQQLLVNGKVTANNGSNHVFSSSPTLGGTIKPPATPDAPSFCF